MKSQTLNPLQMFDLGFCIVNFETETVTWKPMQFSPKRQNLVNSFLEKGSLPFNWEETVKRF